MNIDSRMDTFTKSGIEQGTKDMDLWAVWPCGTECSLAELRNYHELLTFMGDDYQIRCAIGYNSAHCPIYG